MGNYVSCTLATPLIKHSKASRVIFPGGEVRQFRQPLKAAELMLECPNHFLCNSRSLHIGRRFSALSADEELELGNVYIMFPMRRVNSIVTAADMAMLFMAANTAAKRISGGKMRILPESGGGGGGRGGDAAGVAEAESSVKEERDDQVGGFDQVLPEFKYRLAACRSRKPMLETIKEEPVRSR